MTEKIIRPHFKLLKMDETYMWDEEMVAKVDKIFGIYLVDVSRSVYLCELQPNYEAYFLYSIWEGKELPEDEEEEFNEMVDEADYATQLVSYFHVCGCRPPTMWVHDFGAEEAGHWEDNGGTELEWKSRDYDSYDDLLDETKEYCNANHHV